MAGLFDRALRGPLLLMLMLVWAVAGCGGDSPETEGEPDWVELGAGLQQFTPLADGDTIELVLGPQGSWHVDLGARFAAPPDGVTVTYRLRDIADEQQLAYPVQVFVQHDGVSELTDGSYARSGDRVILTMAASEAVGRQVRAELEAIVDGDIVRDERVLSIIDDEP